MDGPPIVMQGERANPLAIFPTLEAIPALGYDVTNEDAAWNADETEIYLASERITGLGGKDIYISVLE